MLRPLLAAREGRLLTQTPWPRPVREHASARDVTEKAKLCPGESSPMTAVVEDFGGRCWGRLRQVRCY